MKKWIILFCCVVWFCVLIPVSASELPHQDALLEVVKNNTFLAEGELGVLEFKGEVFLISVGVSIIEGTSPNAKLIARKTARMKADERLVKFIHGTKVSVQETLVSHRVVKVEQVNDKVVSKESELSTEYIERIAEQAQGLLKNVTNLGRWKSQNATRYHVALAVLMKR